MTVDFPAPFGPVNPYFRPDENVVVTSSKRTFDPKRIDTPLTVIINLRLYRITGGSSSAERVVGFFVKGSDDHVPTWR